MKLPPYPRYKPSGVEWLGDVPEHWEVKRLKWVGESIIGLTYSPTDVVSETEGTLVLRSSNIQGGRIVLDDNVFVSAEIPRKLRTRANDIVICTRNGSRELVGKTGKISERESGLTFGAFTAVFRSPSNAYMFYVFNSGLFSFQAGLYQTSTIFQLTNGTINAFQIPLPPSAEQKAIAAFLDRETGRVDRLVAKKRELIERLKEKRTALISRTVTRGLPPAAARAAGLPERSTLKPTGLDWLGDIPKHWEVKKFGYISVVVRGASPRPAGDPRYFDGDFIPWITVGEVTKDEKVFLTATETMLTEEGAANSRTIRSGTLVLTNSGATLGVPKILSLTGCANDGIVAFEGLSKAVNKFFLYYYLRSLTENLRDRIKQGSGQPNLNTDIVKALGVPFPPLPEQAAIAAYLDAETAKLDALVGKVESAVERLQEYRTALITAAVTGKIDVRQAVPAASSTTPRG